MDGMGCRSRWRADDAITGRQKLILGALCVAIAICAFTLPYVLVLAPVAFITFAYLVAGVYKAVMLLRGQQDVGHGTGSVAADPHAILDHELPIYTVLVPLYREGKFAPVLVEQLLALDYPQNQLQVLLLVENDDAETWLALEECALPRHIQMIGVPTGMPRTKPRALNVGLAWARGEFVVVYDAEDRPERDQLRKAVAMFRALPRRAVCLQARLNFYNRHQSLLTRLFSMDYTIWYDMLLPGMTGKQTIVPLGGTSNHFRIDALRRLGGWDPYNVTEDADLGVRIARARLSVMMLDSVTWEEAVARVPQWVRQRSRWVKGYMQTYLVHMRHPAQLLRQVGPRAFLDFQIMVGGSSLHPARQSAHVGADRRLLPEQRHGARPDDSVAVSVSAVLSGAALSARQFRLLLLPALHLRETRLRRPCTLRAAWPPVLDPHERGSLGRADQPAAQSTLLGEDGARGKPGREEFGGLSLGRARRADRQTGWRYSISDDSDSRLQRGASSARIDADANRSMPNAASSTDRCSGSASDRAIAERAASTSSISAPPTSPAGSR